MALQFHRQPLQLLYRAYARLTLVFLRLPVWFLTYLVLPSRRPRPSWGIRRNIIVKSLRVKFDAMLMAGFPPEQDLREAAASADSLGFVWVNASPDLVVGELHELAALNGVEAQTTSGYWYGKRGSDGKVGQKAAADEKVIYHLHGTPVCHFHAYGSPELYPTYRWWVCRKLHLPAFRIVRQFDTSSRQDPRVPMIRLVFAQLFAQVLSNTAHRFLEPLRLTIASLPLRR